MAPRRAPLLALLLGIGLAAGCSRPLAKGEAAFAEALFGAGIDTGKVRVSRGLGLVPPPADVAPFEADLEGFECARTEPKPVKGPPAAFVLGNRMFYSTEFYATDTMLGWPDAPRPAQALVLAHELSHVWQWQNRATTSYSPFRAAGESVRAADPYFYRPGQTGPFLSFGFEQQASLIQDYVCYTLIAPSDPRRKELRAVLAPVLSVDRFEAAVLPLR